jgi:rifampicin phosphotransferase
MSIQNPEQQLASTPSSNASLVLPLTAINSTSLALVGGKAANLGEMSRVGLPVPSGFCVTTISYALATEGGDLESVLDELASTRADDVARLEGYATTVRERILALSIPIGVVEAIAEAYKALGNGEPIPVAVRSSATAEDLPFASFAGQQDTYLNMVGIEAVLDAVRRCWASLWTSRAVSYRASNGIDPRTVRLAVAVQRMVEAQVAGILFTANPLTGKRRQAVIDASPGLGEAVVSGAVNPDRFVVNTPTGEIVERRLGDKRILIQAAAGGSTQRIEKADSSSEPCLSDEQIRALAALGAKVEAHYKAPQDIEWAIDLANTLWLTQARPITTLYPLPPDAPETDDILRVYFSVNVAQGVYRPFTPMGISAFRVMFSSIATFLGLPPHDLLAGPSIVKEAGYRLFADVTPALRTSFGRNLLGRIMGVMEARTGVVFQQLAADPRLSLVATPRWRLLRTMLSLLERSRAPFYMVQALFRPDVARTRVKGMVARLRTWNEASPEATPAERLTAIEHFFLGNPARIFSSIIPVLISALGSYALASQLLEGLATDDEKQTILRALPYNPTTEMDLALWSLAQQIQADPTAAQAVSETPAEQLALDYRKGTLPPTLQQGLAEFLRTYGHRGVAEIDLGLPRWSEDPTHILGVLANYLQLKNPELAPDVQFRRGAQEAEEMVTTLTRRAARKNRWRGVLVGFLLSRVRALAGLREMPKFCLVTLLAGMRELLWPIGEELARAGRLDTAEDIFFITLQEARDALSGRDLRAAIKERHASYEQELKRRHIPRVLLSDGTDPETLAQAITTTEDTLKGTPASAGTVTAKARVILNPAGARLEPGEILVAPSTDPGWTPLFLTASGLVMEMGGAMSHGAVVAREYGIPAVVGVYGATERITTGQRITIDGSSGMVSIL